MFERLDKYQTEAMNEQDAQKQRRLSAASALRNFGEDSFPALCYSQQSHPPIQLNSIEEISSGQAQIVGTCLLDPDPEIRKEASPNLYFHSSPVSFLGSGFQPHQAVETLKVLGEPGAATFSKSLKCLAVDLKSRMVLLNKTALIHGA